MLSGCRQTRPHRAGVMTSGRGEGAGGEREGQHRAGGRGEGGNSLDWHRGKGEGGGGSTATGRADTQCRVHASASPPRLYRSCSLAVLPTSSCHSAPAKRFCLASVRLHSRRLLAHHTVPTLEPRGPCRACRATKPIQRRRGQRWGRQQGARARPSDIAQRSPPRSQPQRRSRHGHLQLDFCRGVARDHAA